MEVHRPDLELDQSVLIQRDVGHYTTPTSLRLSRLESRISRCISRRDCPSPRSLMRGKSAVLKLILTVCSSGRLRPAWRSPAAAGAAAAPSPLRSPRRIHSLLIGSQEGPTTAPWPFRFC